jgi:hypothetical protein
MLLEVRTLGITGLRKEKWLHELRSKWYSASIVQHSGFCGRAYPYYVSVLISSRYKSCAPNDYDDAFFPLEISD